MMQSDAISAASLWGLSKWSPDPACQQKLSAALEGLASPLKAAHISLSTVADLLRPLGEESPERICGLASDQSHNCGGVLLPLFESSATVGDSLAVLLRYNPLHASPVVWQIRADGDYLFLSIWVDTNDSVDGFSSELMAALGLFQVTAGLGSVTGGAFKPESIHIAPSCNAMRWPDSFSGIPIVADSPQSGLLIHREILQRPNKGYSMNQKLSLQDADSALDALRHRESKQVMRREIKGWIRAALPTGRYQLTRLAERMHCDKRTLQRRLMRELGVSFQCLLDESRDEVVLPMLQSGVFPVSLIAAHAGFSNTGNFSRYFSGRFGCSPLGWADQNNRATGGPPQHSRA